MTYASTAVLALLVHLIIHFDAIRNDHYRNETAPGKAYRALVCTVMLFYVSDALWGVLYDARLIPAVYADTVLYFAAMAASLFFWGRFVILFLHEKSRFMRFLSAVSYLAPAFFGLAQVVNFFLPVMFWFDGDGVYRAGFLRYAALLVQVLMFIAVSAYLFVTLHRTEGRVKSRHAAIGIVGAVMAAMVVLQAFFPM